MLTKIGRFLLSLTLLLFAVAVHAQVPTASISCPATALVGEPVICSGTGSTNVNGQIGWSTKTFLDGTAPVAWNFGDNAGPYSKAEILKATHVYLAAGTYTISLTVKDSGGVSASNTASITISDIPAATGGAIQTLSDQGSESANRTALQNAINTAMANNTVPQKIRLPNITYVGPFSFPAATGTQYVTIEPIETSWLPGPLKRVTSALASNMPKIKSPGPDQVSMAIDGAGRGYVRFLGVEFNKTPGGHLYQLVKLVLGTTGGASDLLILNNIGEYRNYGFFGDGGSQGDGAIAAYMSDGYFRYNVMSDDTSGLDGTSWTAPRGAPNYFPATIDTNTFVDRPNGDYHLKSTSPYKAGGATPAADGTDIGVNFDNVTTATANTISGDWSGGPVGGFVTDTFTEASDTTLASHTGEVGARGPCTRPTVGQHWIMAL